MNFKKIIALICALAILCTSTGAYTPIFPDDEQQTEQEQNGEAQSPVPEGSDEKSDSAESTADAESKDGSQNSADSESKENSKAEESENKSSSPTYVSKSRNFYYRLFMQILNTYVENHLYEFTHEDVLYKFFEDFLTDNPMYFKYMTNYMLGTMDDYSSYHEAKDGFLDGDVISTGFGIQLGADENGRAFVEKVLPNTKAEQAGILAGDKFVSVMGFKVDDLPLDAVTTIISSINTFIKEDELKKDDEDNIYSFEFERNGEIVPITLSKGIMVSSPIDTYIEIDDEKQIGVITLSAFLGEGTDKAFVDAVKAFSEQGIERLTIDLRDNGGGNLDFALTMVECFVPNGELLCYYNDRTLEEPKAVYSTTDECYKFKSIAILVNENTASAAELFSHILHVKGLAKLIGTKTVGKGIGQTVYTLATGDYITITTYEVLDQNMENYNEIGLIPDLEIEDIEILYELPELLWFNHENYKEIKEGQYSDATKALEDRLNIAGFLTEEYSDGVFDDTTRRALYALQLYLNLEPTGVLDDKTVTKITSLINSYKGYTYTEDSPYEVSLFMHRSFSQGKRRRVEILNRAEKEQKKIDAYNKALEEALEAEDKAKEEAREKAKKEAEVTEQASAQSTQNSASQDETAS